VKIVVKYIQFSFVFLYPLLFLLLFLTSCFLISCGPQLSDPEEVEEFNRVGLLSLVADANDIDSVLRYAGPYKVVIGDILEFKMSTELKVTSSELTEWIRPTWTQNNYELYYARVDDCGLITLPIIREVDVAGYTLAEIEQTVIDAYYPKYVVEPPMVVCEVFRYKNENERIFAVMGLVKKPNSFVYPSDVQYSLLEALAFAGGLNMIADPRYLQVYRQSPTGEVVSATFGIDNKSLSNASRVIIRPGDIIYVDHTLRTRTNQFLSDVFQLRVGINANRSLDTD